MTSEMSLNDVNATGTDTENENSSVCVLKEKEEEKEAKVSSNVKIVEQPEKSFRFRYDSEKRLSISIAGASSDYEEHTYPTIMVSNYTGPVCVFVSCVTHTTPYRQHHHKAYSTDDADMNTSCRFGAYRKIAEIKGSGKIELKDISIEYVKNDKIVESLQERKDGNINPTKSDWEHMENPRDIDPNNVRLCFQVIGMGDGNKHTSIGAAISTPITNKKICNILNIIDLRPRSASMMGGDKVILMCDRVNYQDIAVRIYEENDEKEVIWAETLMGEDELMVHHQLNILFSIPRYHNISVKSSRMCFIQLYRPSDGETSEPVLFEFKPLKKNKNVRNGNRSVMLTAMDMTKEITSEILSGMDEMSLENF